MSQHRSCQTAGQGACVNVPEASLAWYTLFGPDAIPGATPAMLNFTEPVVTLATALANSQTMVFATEQECCR